MLIHSCKIHLLTKLGTHRIVRRVAVFPESYTFVMFRLFRVVSYKFNNALLGIRSKTEKKSGCILHHWVSFRKCLDPVPSQNFVGEH